MCSSNRSVPGPDAWVRSLDCWAWKNRVAVVPAALAALVAAAVGLLVHFLGPTDIEQAEAELVKARAVVCADEEESLACGAEAKGHWLRSAAYQKKADEHRDTSDVEWLEWHHALADGHAQIGRAKFARRDTLTHRTAVNLRLLAEAECEILRAKDARDRGTPYEVAPRVRDLLAPVRAGR